MKNLKLEIDSNGDVVVPHAGSSTTLDVSALAGQQEKTFAELVTAPAAADSTGTTGQVAIADGFFYACVATDTWQRVAIATWE